MSNIRGPFISTVLYEAHTDELAERIGHSLENAATQMARQYSAHIAELIKEAYNQGLHDGFAQGVAAAHNAAEEVA